MLQYNFTLNTLQEKAIHSQKETTGIQYLNIDL